MPQNGQKGPFVRFADRSGRLLHVSRKYPYTERFGISDVRTLFVLATDARGDIRLNNCIEVNKYFNKGQGTGLFLFTKAETLLEAPDILEAPLISGKGKTRTLVG